MAIRLVQSTQGQRIRGADDNVSSLMQPPRNPTGLPEMCIPSGSAGLVDLQVLPTSRCLQMFLRGTGS